MKRKFPKILYFLVCFLLIFEQSGFAQVGAELDLSSQFSRLSGLFVANKFRPAHLRYISYDNLNNNFNLLLDKGDPGDPATSEIENSTKTLLNYFFIGISLPNDSFWVNLRPDSPQDIIDPYLGQTDIGKILLEADLQLKKDTAGFTSPQTSEGKEYWSKLYKKAGELFAGENVSIPTLTRPWIVPNEIIIRESTDNAYIYKATLKVMLEQDYLKDSSVYSFKDDRQKALNEYSSQLMRELIIPKLTKEVNSSKRYAPLRQVYYSLILAQWFKQKFYGKGGLYSWLIDKRNLTNLTSKTAWDKQDYFQQYKSSFQQGEYNTKESVNTVQGQSMRSYMSGGISFGPQITGMIASSAIVSKRDMFRGVKNLVEFVVSGSQAINDPSNVGISRRGFLKAAGVAAAALALDNTGVAEALEKVSADINQYYVPSDKAYRLSLQKGLFDKLGIEIVDNFLKECISYSNSDNSIKYVKRAYELLANNGVRFSSSNRFKVLFLTGLKTTGQAIVLENLNLIVINRDLFQWLKEGVLEKWLAIRILQEKIRIENKGKTVLEREEMVRKATLEIMEKMGSMPKNCLVIEQMLLDAFKIIKGKLGNSKGIDYDINRQVMFNKKTGVLSVPFELKAEGKQYVFPIGTGKVLVGDTNLNDEIDIFELQEGFLLASTSGAFAVATKDTNNQASSPIAAASSAINNQSNSSFLKEKYLRNSIFPKGLSQQEKEEWFELGQRIMPSKEDPRGYRISRNSYWPTFDTSLSRIDKAFLGILQEPMSEKIVKLATDKKEQPVYILSWGAGNLKADVELASKLKGNEFKIYTFGDTFGKNMADFTENELVPIFDIAGNLVQDIPLGQKMDVIYSYAGIHFLLNTDQVNTNETAFLNYLNDLTKILSDKGFIIFNIPSEVKFEKLRRLLPELRKTFEDVRLTWSKENADGYMFLQGPNNQSSSPVDRFADKINQKLLENPQYPMRLVEIVDFKDGLRGPNEEGLGLHGTDLAKLRSILENGLGVGQEAKAVFLGINQKGEPFTQNEAYLSFGDVNSSGSVILLFDVSKLPALSKWDVGKRIAVDVERMKNESAIGIIANIKDKEEIKNIVGNRNIPVYFFEPKFPSLKSLSSIKLRNTVEKIADIEQENYDLSLKINSVEEQKRIEKVRSNRMRELSEQMSPEQLNEFGKDYLIQEKIASSEDIGSLGFYEIPVAASSAIKQPRVEPKEDIGFVSMNNGEKLFMRKGQDENIVSIAFYNQNGEQVGFTDILLRESLLNYIYINPNFRSNNYSKVILDAILEKLQDQSITSRQFTYVSAYVQNPLVVNFLLEKGFILNPYPMPTEQRLMTKATLLKSRQIEGKISLYIEDETKRDAFKNTLGNEGFEIVDKPIEGETYTVMINAKYTLYLEEKSGETQANSALPVYNEGQKTGGIDFRALPIASQPVLINQKVNASIIPPIPLAELNSEWLRIENMLASGITPSSERIKEYLQSCSQQQDFNQDIDKVLSCIADIFRFEEERVADTDASLRAMLMLLESDKPVAQIQLALAQITVQEKEPKLLEQ